MKLINKILLSITMIANKKILDVACSARRFYFDKANPLVHYNDLFPRKETLCDGRVFTVDPDSTYDFRNLPFEDNSFYMVVFDPPHIKNISENSYMAIEYGKLNKNWKEDIKKGFDECFRVCKFNGTIIFKWNNHDIKVKDILEVIGKEPVLGQKTRSSLRSSTHWFVFFKEKDKKNLVVRHM